jgi:signal transduction histidine kinase
LRHVRRGGTIVLQVGYDATRSTLRISVRDDGPGISSERLNRLLRREDWHPGSAFALLLVEDIAVALGGAITMESNSDRYDHFTQISSPFRHRFQSRHVDSESHRAMNAGNARHRFDAQAAAVFFANTIFGERCVDTEIRPA